MKTNIYHYLLTLPKIWIYGIIMLFCSSSHSVLANGNELFPIRPSEVLFEINSNNRKGNLAEHSEQISVSGRVLDEIDQPLPGATVLEKDTQNGTVTGYDGRFTLSVANDATLLISFLGYKSQEVKVNGSTDLTIQLKPDLTNLEEIVVMGYGNQRRSDITSAVSEVDVDLVENIGISNASRLLQGQAPGVQVKQTTGSPGQEFEVRIRGISSLGATSDPLYVVDGFPLANNVGQYVDANDIESITILKDAASTSIYGARGSNGVVLITTKSGKDGVSKLDINIDQGFHTVPNSRRVEVLNAQQFVQFQNERVTDDFRRIEGRDPMTEEIPAAWRSPGQVQPSTNWQDEILRTALVQDVNLSMSNGTEKLKSYLSLGYLNQEGVIKKTDFQVFNGRINLSNKFNDYVKVDWNLSGRYSTRNDPGNTIGGNFTTSVISAAYLADPRDPVYNEDGSFNDYIGGRDGVFGYQNPVQVLHEITNYTAVSYLLSNGAIELTPLKGLSLKTSVNVSIENGRGRFFKPSTIADWNNPPPTIANSGERAYRASNYTFDNILSYVTSLYKNEFDFTAGYVVQKARLDNLSGNGEQFPDDLIPHLSAASETSSSSNIDGWGLVAFLGRVNYAYDHKYLLSASYRREGSSRFGQNNKWGDFPAFSLGWRVSEEAFFPWNAFVSDLKLRGSWGVTGNNNIGDFTHLARLSANNYVLGGQLAGGRVISNFGNPDLKWETSRQLDIGVDIGLFDDKIMVVTEFYKRTTEDMLLPLQVPATTGFGTALSNIGKVENKGFELGINYRETFGDFRIRTNFNIAFNRNEILALDGDLEEIFVSNDFYGGNNIFRVGQPIGMLYGFKKLKIFETEEEISNAPSHPGNTVGTYQYEDVNGDGQITYDRQDWTIIGNPNPDFTWGLNINLEYKNFDLSINFTGAQNYDLFRNIEPFTMNVDGVFNVDARMINRWRSPGNPGIGGWASTGNFQFTRETSSRFVYDASHLWFRTLTLGYNFPKISEAFDLRFYSTIDNFLLFTNYPGNNPESNSGNPFNPQTVTIGVDNDHYPVPRTFSLGLNINF